MKTLICLLFVTAIAAAQTLPSDFVAAGVSYNQGATPAIGGTGLYAHKLLDSTYSVSVADVLPTAESTWRAPVVVTSITTGIGQRLYTFGGTVPVWAIAAAGSGTSGTNTGWTWTSGGAAFIPLGRGFYLMPTARVVKPSVADYRAIVGLMVGWGK